MRKLFGALLVAVMFMFVSGCELPGSTSSSDDKKTEKKDEGLTEDNFADTISSAQSEAGTVHADLDGGDALEGITYSGDFTIEDAYEDTNGLWDLNVDSTYLQVLLLEGDLYASAPDEEPGIWIHSGPDANDEVSNIFRAMYFFADPQSLVLFADETKKSFDNKGADDKIDGVETQKLVIKLDPKKFADSDVIDFSALGIAEFNDSESATLTLWVGDDNLIRRANFDIEGESVDVEFSQWGEVDDNFALPSDAVVVEGTDVY